MLLVQRFQWMIPLISLNKRLFNSMNHALMKKASTAHLLSQHSPVFSPLTCISTVLRHTTGAHAGTPRTLLFAMDSASRSWPDAALLPSTSLSLVTTNSATARCQLTLPSAMVLTSNCWDGFTDSTEVSGVSMVLSASGCASPTGCSLSTSEELPNLDKRELSCSSL